MHIHIYDEFEMLHILSCIFIALLLFTLIKLFTYIMPYYIVVFMMLLYMYGAVVAKFPKD